jgi:acetyltransferase-like isoleucine patch superfamily enzyme
MAFLDLPNSHDDHDFNYDQVQNLMLGKNPVSIGRFTYGAENLDIIHWNEGAALNLGAFCSIADNIKVLLGGNHRVDFVSTFPFGFIFRKQLTPQKMVGHPATKGDINIGNDVWIGSGVTIMSGVTIGSGAAIAANSTVTKDVEPYEIVGGNPAEPIKRRFSEDVIELLLELRWWDLETEQIQQIIPYLTRKPDPAKLIELIELFRS